MVTHQLAMSSTPSITAWRPNGTAWLACCVFISTTTISWTCIVLVWSVYRQCVQVNPMFLGKPVSSCVVPQQELVSFGHLVCTGTGGDGVHVSRAQDVGDENGRIASARRTSILVWATARSVILCPHSFHYVLTFMITL